MSKIKNIKLLRIINDNYRPWAHVGNGSTADAIRNELITWQPTGWKFHKIKWKEILNRLDKWINSNADEYNKKWTDYEIRIAKQIMDDIFDALYNTKK